MGHLPLEGYTNDSLSIVLISPPSSIIEFDGVNDLFSFVNFIREPRDALQV